MHVEVPVNGAPAMRLGITVIARPEVDGFQHRERPREVCCEVLELVFGAIVEHPPR